MHGVVTEALASGKLVSLEGCSKGSQPAKSGTDEQKPDTRLFNADKQAHFGRLSASHHCNVRRIQDRFIVDQAVIGGREKLLPGDTLTTTSLVKSRSQQRLL